MLLFLSTQIITAQNSLENIGVLLPQELKEWEFIKSNINPEDLFKNAESVKTFITKNNEPVKIYEFYQYHPESNKSLIPNVTFYIFPNVTPIGDYPNMVTAFFNQNRKDLTDVKNITNETFLNGNVPEYLQHYSYKEEIYINKRKTNVNVNMVQALIFKSDYILFIDAYQPVEPNYASPKIYNEKKKEEIVKLIKEIKIKETLIIKENPEH